MKTLAGLWELAKCLMGLHHFGPEKPETNWRRQTFLARTCAVCGYREWGEAVEKPVPAEIVRERWAMCHEAEAVAPAPVEVGPTLRRMLAMQERGRRFEVPRFSDLPAASQKFVLSLKPGAREGFGKLGKRGIFECMRGEAEDA